MAKRHELPLLSGLPERFAWRCRVAPSVDRFENGLSPVGNAVASKKYLPVRLPVLLPERSVHH